jgi:hypothetical protein
MSFIPNPDKIFLFPAKSASENSPNWRGDVLLSKELIQKIISCYSSGQEFKLSVALWNKTGKSGGYLSGVVSEAIAYTSPAAKPEKVVANDCPF